MKYAVMADSVAMICIPSFIKICSGFQKFITWVLQTQTAWRSHKPTFIFYNKEGIKN
jgi:hypothetical protein